MLPTVDSNLLAVKGGNYRLAEKLLEASNATLHLGAEVVLVEKAETTYLIHTQVMPWIEISFQELQKSPTSLASDRIAPGQQFPNVA